MLKQDFVLNAIEQLGAALARILGLQRAAKFEQGLEAVAQAKTRLPIVPGMMDQLSAASLAKALDDEELVRHAAQLYRLEAELAFALGDEKRAARCMARSKALLEVTTRPPTEEDYASS